MLFVGDGCAALLFDRATNMLCIYVCVIEGMLHRGKHVAPIGFEDINHEAHTLTGEDREDTGQACMAKAFSCAED